MEVAFGILGLTVTYQLPEEFWLSSTVAQLSIGCLI
jgi:hypothetical protein